MYTLEHVKNKKQWDDFIDFPWSIYKNDPNWVPPLKIAVREILDVNKNPFFKHAYMKMFVAYKDGKPVGRIAGFIDENHNKFQNEKTAHFGYYEAIDDLELAKKLLEAVKDWAKSWKMTVLRGPVNTVITNEPGCLVEGRDDPPTLMSSYCPAYYETHFEKLGFKKAMDLYAYNLNSRGRFTDRLMAQAEKLKNKTGVRFREFNPRDFDNELKRIMEVYNQTWEKNWGFVPFETDEIEHLAKELKQIYDPRLVLFVEVGGKVAGFGLALPDVNQAIRKIPDGKLLPTGIFKLLWNTKGPGRRKTIRRVRVWALGIKKEYQPMGLGPLLYSEYLKRGMSLGYDGGECSWVLENNAPMNKAMQMMCGERSKVYRIYDQSLQ